MSKKVVVLGCGLVGATIARDLAELESELSPEVFAAALERGKSLDLETVVRELLTTR